MMTLGVLVGRSFVRRQSGFLTAIRRIQLSIFTVIAIFCLSACDGDSDEDKNIVKLSSWSEAEGVWLMPGMGYVFKVEGDSSTMYQFTRNTCILEESGKAEELDKSFVELELKKDDSQIKLTAKPVGEPSEYRREIFIKQEVIPPACEQANEDKSFDPLFVFEHFWHVFNDYYPFFDLHDVDWQSQYDVYAPLISATTTQEELFVILQEMLKQVDDPHTSLRVETEDFAQEYTPAMPEGLHKIAEYESLIDLVECSDEGGCDDEELNHISVMRFINYVLSQHYFESPIELRGADGYQMGWSIIKDKNIGYLQINQMLGYAMPMDQLVSLDGNIPIDEELKAVSHLLDNALSFLADTDGLIIDVRANTGGSDTIALHIASYFAEEKMEAFTWQNYNTGDLTSLQTNYIEPSSSLRYLKPITLITGPDTTSSGETFTLAMRNLPQVTHIGESTRGALSDILELNLAEGWTIGLSHEIFYDLEGNRYEKKGVAPEVSVPVTSLMSLNAALFPEIQQALKTFGKTPVSLAREDLIARVSAIMEASGTPGVAIAVVEKEKVLDMLTFGYADTESERPISIDTPFHLASVSKLFVGTAIAKAVENNLLSLDLKISDSALPFSPDHPGDPNDTLNLRHLVTHTGSFDDPGTYDCGYYIDADFSSLVRRFTGFECPEPVETNQLAFLESHFSDGGGFYSTNNFLNIPGSSEYVPPGHIRRYSNMGTALAAEVFASELGQGIDDYLRTELFAPLNMSTSFWRGDNPAAEEPAVRYVITESEILRMPEYSLSTWSDGALKSSLHDMTKFLRMMTNKGELDGVRVLSEDSVATMLSDQTQLLDSASDTPAWLRSSNEDWQGIFWNVGELAYGHGGGDPGVETFLLYDQFDDLGLVLLTNASSFGDVDSGFDDILRLVGLYGHYLKSH